MQLSVQEVRQLAEAAMAAAGHSTEDSRIIADHLVDCELRGLGFGGLARALSIVERLRRVDERRPIRVLQESAASACLDGGDQVGYLVGRRATEIAIGKARATGMAAVGASKTWYTGMFSYYLEMVTAAGFVGMITGSGSPKVAPHGGTEARFNTNPIAFGFPSEGTPVIWDIGTSSVMAGEVTLKKRLAEQLAPGQALDRSGRPTLDPAEAMAGALTVWGGHKGSGLALSVQLLSIMAGQVTVPVELRDCGFFITVFNPDLFTPPGEFRRRVSEYAALLRANHPVDATQPLRVPFERSAAERSRGLAADRIEVDDRICHALREAACK
jgi:LDH2 family malate/lactate/ureidoglycolate dehydrogenase